MERDGVPCPHVAHIIAFQGFSFWLVLSWSCGLKAHLWLGYIGCSGECLWGYFISKESGSWALLLRHCGESSDLCAILSLRERSLS